MIIKHEANDKKTTEFMEAFMKKNQKNYQKNEKNNDPLMETINRLFPVGKEMTPEDIDIITDMIVNMSPIKRTPEELAAIRKEIELGLILANADVDENAVIRIHKDDRTRIKEIEQRLKVIAEDIKNIDNYRKYKPVADKLETVVFKEKFRREHESELIIFTAAEKYLKKRFGGEKAPLIKELLAEQKKLYAEKDRLYNSYNATKSEIKELDMVMKNVDMILGKDKEKDRQRDVQRKRSGELE